MYLCSSKDDRSLDTLLEFINGPEEENHKMSSRAAKRQRRKQRKVLIVNQHLTFSITCEHGCYT